LALVPINDEVYLAQTGAPALWGEKGYSPIERVGARPTLDVNGLLAGYTGKGTKTVIPSWAMAKISMRLVPRQDPSEVYQQLKRFMEMQAPKTIRWEVANLNGSPACFTDLSNPETKALADALEEVWGKTDF